MNCGLNGMSIQDAQNMMYTDPNNTGVLNDSVYYPPQTIWDFWERHYYPEVIKVGYPVYLQERAMDKGAKAFEILKMLTDKKIVKMEKVSDFIDAMDALIKVL